MSSAQKRSHSSPQCRQSRQSRRRRYQSLPAGILSASLIAALLLLAGPFSAFSVARGATSPAMTPVVTPCGVSNMSSVEQPAQPAPTAPVHLFVGGSSSAVKFAVSTFSIVHTSSGDRLYILDGNAGHVYIYDMTTATQVGSFTAPWTPNTYQMAVDPSGNVYLAQGNSVSQFSSSGQLKWTSQLQATIDGLYTLSPGGNLRIGVVQRGRAGSTLLSTAGAVVGQNGVTGSTFTTDPSSGELMSTDTHYVRVYDANGTFLNSFGAAQNGNAPGPFHFYELGGAALASDGRMYLADAGRGIDMASSDGFYQGTAADSTLGSLTERSSMAFYNGNLYFANGGQWNSHQGVSYISLSNAQALVARPHAPQPVLGFGARLLSSATANYYPAGQTPQVNVVFDSWWTVHAGDVTGQVTVRDRAQVLAGQAGTTQTFQLPGSTTSSAITIPVSLPATQPGYYQVEAQLLKGGAVVGDDCLYYGVGAPGNTLNMNSLPDAPDYGGAPPARNVALAKVLGFGLVRLNVDWSQLLPGGASSTAPLNFSAYDSPFQEAAQQASATGVTLELQVGKGQATEKALVQNGTWPTRVQQLVAHYKSLIHYWEAWNEPNNTFGTPSSYVSQVLIPFYQAVKAADPSAKVVGGTVAGLDFSYWGGIGQAGGFQYMDVIGIHAYTSHNRSFEEQGWPAAFQHFQQVLGQYNASQLPIWDTEDAWWSDGPANFYSQADKLIRYRLLSYDAGLQKMAYFITEGGFSDNGVSDSLIQYSSPQNPYYVKPAALAAMVYQTQIGNRSYLGQLSTNTPDVYGLLFGPGAGQTGDLLVLWSDDLQTSEQVSVSSAVSSLSVTDLLGRTSTVALNNGGVSLPVDGSPRYIQLPDTTAPTLAPAETFGPDWALVNFGTSATASSSNPSNLPANAIDGRSNANGATDFYLTPAWASGPNDAQPTLTLTWPQPMQIDRVLVSGHSNGNIEPGLRDYDVQALTNGTWTTVASVRGAFYWRRQLVTFPLQTTTAVRIVVKALDYGGLAGGALPWFWPTDSADLTNLHAAWYGPAIIDEVEAYGPGTLPSQPTATPIPFSPVHVNVGGGAYTDSTGVPWKADYGYNGGSTAISSRPITGTNDPSLYQTERYGNFNYMFNAPNGDYNVTLKFSENVWTTPGQRVFNVSINGQQVLTNFDILSQVPQYTVLDRTFPVHVSNGLICIYFSAVVDAAKVDAIQIVSVAPSSQTSSSAQVVQPSATVTPASTYTAQPVATNTVAPTSTPGPASTNTAAPTSTPVLPTATSTPVLPTATSTPVLPTATSTPTSLTPTAIHVRAGGSGTYTAADGTSWASDYGYTGGSADGTNHTIAGTANGPLYQRERYGNFSYTFAVPNGAYNVTLKFAESTWTQTGKRVFNVAINGQPVLTNFDILSQVTPNTALDKTFAERASNGTITLSFTTVRDAAKVDAIDIEPTGP